MSTEQPTEAWEEAGFEYDGGDPTVGIQPGWAHWCGQAQVEESDPSVDINEGWAFLHYLGTGINRKAVGDKSLVCNECGAQGPYATIGCRDPDEEDVDLEAEAVDAWNKRAPVVTQ